MNPGENSTWLTLMYEVQKFTRERLQRPDGMSELQRLLPPQASQMFDLARPEIIRVCQLLVPGLLVDFLAKNKEILNTDGLNSWAADPKKGRL
jgi:hypothetical protein